MLFNILRNTENVIK